MVDTVPRKDEGAARVGIGKRGRAVIVVAVAGLAGLIATGLLVAALRGSNAERAAVPTAVSALTLEPTEIYPSLAKQAPRRRSSYRQLFVAGQTMEAATAPACARYRKVRRAWWRRGESIRRSSQGAGISKAAAARYYAAVVWVSQDEAGDFRNAISRVSRSRLSLATGGAVKRGYLVRAFTRDALALCGLSAAYARTVRTLGRLDGRIARIIDLARFDGSGSENQATQ